ncbi:SLC16A12 [Mytilus edulis]|uniref:Major facilitator superfamily (MFS) profile domain-containing protein n=2 Tax=Mytilus TaxID=6548 RepID=A0A8B6EEV8_MYTGA|nr:SLC16A12 [Mytilus edulis]VDI33455.1 Hypothetical predicted protein [Mytilus galloprovincialis]
MKSIGVLYTELLDYYDAGTGNTAWISGVNIFVALALAPFANFFGERYTYRAVMITGSCLILIGHTSSAFVPNIEWLYFTYGIVTGTGYSLIMAPSATVMNFYFKEKRSFANGVMVGSSGFCGMGFPYLYRFLFDTFSLHGALLIIGAIFFNTCAASLCLRQPPMLTQRKRVREKRRESLINMSAEDRKRIVKVGLFENKRFTIYLMAVCFQLANFGGNLVALPGQVRSLQLGKETIALSVSLVGASEIVCRIFLGWVGDLNIMKRTTILMICSLGSCVSAICIPFVLCQESLFVYAVLVALFSGSAWSLVGVIVIDCVGLKDFSPGFGLVYMGVAISTLLTQPLAGWLEDITGNWDMSFRFNGFLSGAAFLLCLLEYLFGNMCSRKMTEEEKSNDCKKTAYPEIVLQCTEKEIEKEKENTRF